MNLLMGLEETLTNFDSVLLGEVLRELSLRMLNLHGLFFRSYPMNGFTIEHLSAEVLSSLLTFCIPDSKTTRVVGPRQKYTRTVAAWKTIPSFTPEIWTITSVKFNAGTKKRDVEQAFNSTQSTVPPTIRYSSFAYFNYRPRSLPKFRVRLSFRAYRKAL